MKSIKFVISSLGELNDEEILKFDSILSALYSLYRKNPDLRSFLLSPFVERSQKLAFLKELRLIANLDEKVDRPLELILELGLLPKLAELRRALLNRLKSTTSATLIFAREQNTQLIEQIKQRMEELTNRRYLIKVSYDPELIGGFIFVSPNVLLDASVKNLLEKVG